MPGHFIDLDAWPRRPHYDFFRGYDHPFFNVCTDVRATRLYERSRGTDAPSFFLGSLWASLQAANAVEEFRLRLRPEGVWRHDRIDGGSTVLRSDDTFGFAYFELADDYATFEARAREILDRARVAGAPLDPADDRDDLVHLSVLPWVPFTSISHPRRHTTLDSVPKVVFGKHFERDGERRLPVSVEVHHALMDGLHVARFLERLEGAVGG